MARFSTNEEALQSLSKTLQQKSRELKPIYDSKDPKEQARAEQLKSEIGAIQNQMMMSQGGITGMFGALGGGLAKGVTNAALAIPDLYRMGSNFLSGKNAPSFSDQLTPGLVPTQENAGLFGVGKGLGSSLGLGKTLTALQTGATTFDEMVAGGDPLAQTVLAVSTLGKAGFDGMRNVLKGRQVKKLMAELGPEDANALKDFMVKGQSSSDPLVAGRVAALRTNPKFAELFTTLEMKASELATAGARVSPAKGYNPEDAGKGIYQAVDAKISGLKEKIATAGGPAYQKAMEMAGDTPMVVTDKTQAKILELIKKYEGSDLPDSKNTVSFLKTLQSSLSGKTEDTLTNAVEIKKMTAPQLQAWLTDFGQKAAGGESLITDVSVGTQKKIASAIFGGLKDDLKAMAQSKNVDERAVANLMQGASKQTRKAVEDYQGFISQGLPKELQDTPLSAIDTDTLLNTISNLSGAQQKSVFGVLKNTAPEDYKRVQQFNYDKFVQSARTELPDGSTGVDFKLLARKFNTLPAEEQSKLSLSLGVSADDFAGRMKDAENFFKYQQRFGGEGVKQGLSGADLAELSSAAYLAGDYGAGKSAGLIGRLYNSFKGGLTDEQTLNILISPETKGILRKAVQNPNSVKTLDAIEQSIFKPALSNAVKGTQIGAVAAESMPANAAPAQQTAEPWDIGPPDGGTGTPASSGEPWDVGAPQSFTPAEIEQKIRAQAEAKGYGQYADMFVRQAKQESGLNPYAVSPKGAAGVFQHMAGTAKDLGIDPFDVDQSIAGGIDYMGQQLNKFKDPRLALAAYNWGPANVAKSGLSGAPAETQNYIKNILGS